MIKFDDPNVNGEIFTKDTKFGWSTGAKPTLWTDDLLHYDRWLPDPERPSFADLHQQRWIPPEADDKKSLSYREYLESLPDYRADVEGFIRDNFLEPGSPPIRLGKVIYLKDNIRLEGSRSYSIGGLPEDSNCKMDFFLRGPCSPVDSPAEAEYDDNESIDPKLTKPFNDNYGQPGGTSG